MNPAQPLSNATGGACASDSLNVPPRKSMAAVTPARLHSRSFLQLRVPTLSCLGQRMHTSRLFKCSQSASVFKCLESLTHSDHAKDGGPSWRST